MDEIIYILTNEAMPDYIKIGKTNNVRRRIQDLDWTDIPLPFQCYYAARDILGYKYAIAGPLYWMYEDETLDERRRRIESGE